MNRLSRSFLILAIAFSIPLLLSYLTDLKDINSIYTIRGHYSSELSSINSIDLLLEEVNRISTDNGSPWLEVADSLIQFRFYHGTCRYRDKDNWIASYLGKWIWDDFRMIIKVDDIMKENVGACNQINIVFQSLLEKQGYRYRTVGLNNHLITEVFYDDKWHAFDCDYEPKFSPDRPSMEEIIRNHDSFQSLYQETPGRFFNTNFQNLLRTNELKYYPENVQLAENLRTFHSISGLLSSFTWLIFLLLALITKFL